MQKLNAEIFGALFSNPISGPTSHSATHRININEAMEELNKLLPNRQNATGLKNIAYAKVLTGAGRNRVYVSVSGIGDHTRYLPIFKDNNHLPEVTYNGLTYINIDRLNAPIEPAALRLSGDGKLFAIPHPIDDASKASDIGRVTSVDSESKLIGFVNEKYPNPEDIKSITVVTTLPPCDSCSIVLKEFGHERGADALNVIWGKRPNPNKRPREESSGSSGSYSDSSGSPSSTSTSSSD